MEELQGGRVGIYRKDDHVVRPSLGCTGSVHELLNYLHSNAFTCCPQPIDYNEKQERLSFVDGDTYNYPLTGPIASEKALVSAAKILAHFHEVSEQFIDKNTNDTLFKLVGISFLNINHYCFGDLLFILF